MLVAVTGWGQAKDRALAREAGFDEHFTKPLDPAQLTRALQNASRKLDQAEHAEARKVPITHNH